MLFTWFCEALGRLQELIPMSRWSQRSRYDGPERLIPMFRWSHKVSVHRSCKANPHGRELGSPELGLSCLVLAGPLWGARGNYTFGPKCFFRSNFWACLDSPGRNLRFPLYDNVFCFCALTRLHAAYAAARRTQAASQYRRAGLLFGKGQA